MALEAPGRHFPSWLAPALLTLLGAWLRFYHLADFYAGIDHAYPIAQAIRWLRLGQWPLLGQDTSVLFANPPGMAYLMAVPWALFDSEWGAAFFTAALNLLAVPLTYQAARRAGGRDTGLAAAALAAVNPWVIYFSRGTWYPGLLPFWTTLTFTLLLWALFGRGGSTPGAPRAGLLFAALLALTGQTQMYLLALLSIAPVALILLLNWRRLPRRELAVGAAALAIATGSFGWQLARDWPNEAPRLTRFLQSNAQAQFDSQAIRHAMRLVTSSDYEVVYGNDGSPAWQTRRLLGQGVATGLAFILDLGVLRAIWRVATRRPDAGLWLAVLIWWVAPIAALSFPTHTVNINYLVLSLPAGFVLAAPNLVPLARSRLALPVLAGLAAFSYVLVAAGTAQVAAQPAGRSLDELSIGAAQRMRIAARALADRYHLEEFYTDIQPNSLTAKVGRPLQSVTWAPLPDVVLFQVDHPAIYLRLAQGGRPQPIRLSTTVAEVDYPGQAVLTFDLIRAYSRAEVDTLPQHRVGLASKQGLTLVGYDLEGGQQSLWVYWAVDELDGGRGQWLYAPFAHVLDANGRLAANVAAPGLPGYYYRQGDVFLSHMTLPPLPPGDYSLDLGMEDGLHGLSLNLEPPDGPETDHYHAQLMIQ